MDKILILGKSGTGKTTSARNLDPEKTLFIQGRRKRLPFKNDKFFVENKNKFVLDSNEQLLRLLKRIEDNEKITEIDLVIDDMSYLMLNESMMARKETGFQKFERFAYNVIDIFNFVDTMKTKGTIVFISHSQQNEQGEQEFKTIGRFVSEKFVIEGIFETVFLSNDDHTFTCNGLLPAKSPMGMFEEEEVENDLAEILKTYKEYYN